MIPGRDRTRQSLSNPPTSTEQGYVVRPVEHYKHCENPILSASFPQNQTETTKCGTRSEECEAGDSAERGVGDSSERGIRSGGFRAGSTYPEGRNSATSETFNFQPSTCNLQPSRGNLYNDFIHAQTPRQTSQNDVAPSARASIR